MCRDTDCRKDVKEGKGSMLEHGLFAFHDHGTIVRFSLSLHIVCDMSFSPFRCFNNHNKIYETIEYEKNLEECDRSF